MSADDVNKQHMASMGLAEVPLGQPYATTEAGVSKDNEGRCEEDYDGFRCARSAAHDGPHARGSLRWENEVALDVHQPYDGLIQSCDEAKGGFLHAAHSYSVGEIVHQCPGLYDGVARNAPTKTREGDQPLPRPGQQCVQDLIIEEMQESKRVGMERYGSTLQTFNGRRTIQDVAEEVRDLHVYLKQVEAEAQADRETLVQVVDKVIYEIVFGEDSPYHGEKPIHHRASRPMAEAAVDAIMGWVVGVRRFKDGNDIVDTLVRSGWDSETTYDDLDERDRAMVEAMGQGLMERLGMDASDG